MSDTRNIFADDPVSVESMIRAAGSFVEPSEDLRPRALEAARENYRNRRARRKLGGVVIFCLSLFGLVTLQAPYADVLHSKVTAPSSAEMQQRAIAIGSLPHVGSEWGTAEAFKQLRQYQASWLGHSSPLEQ